MDNLENNTEEEIDLEFKKVEAYLRKSKSGTLEAFLPRNTGVSREKILDYIDSGKIVRWNGYIYENTSEIQEKMEEEARKKEGLKEDYNELKINEFFNKKSKLVRDLEARKTSNFQR